MTYPRAGQAKPCRPGFGNKLRRQPGPHHVWIVDASPKMLALRHVAGLASCVTARGGAPLPFDKRVLQRLAIDSLALRELMARRAELRLLEFRDTHHSAVRGGSVARSNRPGIALRRAKVAMASQVAAGTGISGIGKSAIGKRMRFDPSACRFKCLALLRHRRMALHASCALRRVVGEELSDKPRRKSSGMERCLPLLQFITVAGAAALRCECKRHSDDCGLLFTKSRLRVCEVT